MAARPWNPLLLRNSLAPVSCKNPFRQNHFGNVSLGNFDRQLALATKLFNKQFSSSVFCGSVIPVLYSATVLQ